MTEKVCFPIRFGKSRSRVTLYNRTKALPYYRISYQLGTIRHQRSFKSLREAKAYAEEISEKLASKDISIAQITKGELAQFRAAQEILSPVNCRIDEAAHEYAKATKSLNNVPLENAVRFYLRHNRTAVKGITLGELVDQYLNAKQKEGISEAYYHDLRKRTRSLIEYTQEKTSEINAELIAEYFEYLDFNAVNHNNQYRVIRALINFAQAQGYLSEEIEYLKSVRQKRAIKASYPIYQVKEFESLLNAANEDTLPPLVLLGFCGVRPNEMKRLNWRDIRFDTRTLVIDAAKAKTASRRTVPLCDAALIWLKPFKTVEKPIWSLKSDFWNKSLNRLHRKAEVKQLPNGLRHSYISYRLTLTGDINRTALEAGNSANIIHSNYHALVEDPRMAIEWFEVGIESRLKTNRSLSQGDGTMDNMDNVSRS